MAFKVETSDFYTWFLAAFHKHGAYACRFRQDDRAIVEELCLAVRVGAVKRVVEEPGFVGGRCERDGKAIRKNGSGRFLGGSWGGDGGWARQRVELDGVEPYAVEAGVAAAA